MAGNVHDWIAEAMSTSYRILRGYSFNYSSSAWYAGYFVGYTSSSSDNNFGSRLALYL